MAKGFKHGEGCAVSSGFPEFTYTGDFLFVDDGDSNWRLKLLTSGTLSFTKPNSAAKGIDIFLVGGGGNGNTTSHNGGGGGGGYTLTKKNISVEKNALYEVEIGGSAGSTSAFNFTVNPGSTGAVAKGGNGGSGGGAPGQNGGSDGGNGGGSGGTGQGTTTREFGDSSGSLYAGGGGGSWYYAAAEVIGNPGSGGSGGGGNGTKYDGKGGTSGTPNTGGGGGGGAAGAKGGSGIVIIRNKR